MIYLLVEAGLTGLWLVKKSITGAYYYMYPVETTEEKLLKQNEKIMKMYEDNMELIDRIELLEKENENLKNVFKIKNEPVIETVKDEVDNIVKAEYDNTVKDEVDNTTIKAKNDKTMKGVSTVKLDKTN